VEGNFQNRPAQAEPKKAWGGLTHSWMRRSDSGGLSMFDFKQWIDWGRRPEAEGEDELVHFGASWEELKADLSRLGPDVVAITNLFRENTDETIKTAELVRRLWPDAVIAVGGPNATALPEYLLDKSPAIDFVGLGDGEETMLELVSWLQGRRNLSDVTGVAYRRDGSVCRVTRPNVVTDLDELGHLDYSLVKLERYFAYERAGIMARNRFEYPGAERTVSLVTSRGCPYKCSFCSIHIHAGRKIRRYSVNCVLNEIENLVKNNNVKHIPCLSG